MRLAQTSFVVGLSVLSSAVQSCRADAGMETVVSSWGASVGLASFHGNFTGHLKFLSSLARLFQDQARGKRTCLRSVAFASGT